MDIAEWRKEKKRRAKERWRLLRKQADAKKRAELEAAAEQNAATSASASRPTSVLDPTEVRTPGGRGSWATPKLRRP
jgi:hypothetical protein